MTSLSHPGGGETTPLTRAQGCGAAQTLAIASPTLQKPGDGALALPLRRVAPSDPAAGWGVLDWLGRQGMDRFSEWGADPEVPNLNTSLLDPKAQLSEACSVRVCSNSWRCFPPVSRGQPGHLVSGRGGRGTAQRLLQ
jgi:hypothetical protein